MHGLDPDFGHAIVAAKAFNLLQASVDYFDRRRDEDQRRAKAVEEQRPIALGELGQQLLETEARRRALDAWSARPPVADQRLAVHGEPCSFVGSAV